LIPTNLTPLDIIFEKIGEKGIAKLKVILEDYQKKHKYREGWDTYSLTLTEDEREFIKTCFSECRRMGFVSPYVYNGKLNFSRVMAVKQEDQCAMCERECQRREDIEDGTGKFRKNTVYGYEEPKPCWGESGEFTTASRPGPLVRERDENLAKVELLNGEHAGHVYQLKKEIADELIKTNKAKIAEKYKYKEESA
jgi:hypothetical protein